MAHFDANNPEHQSLADAFANGTHNNLPTEQVTANYQSFLQQAPQAEVAQVHQEYFDQMPKVERMGLFSSILGTLGGQKGIDPHQAGISTTDPNRASAGDLGNLFQFAMNSGVLGNLMGGNQGQGQSGLGSLLGGSNNVPQQPQYNQNGQGQTGYNSNQSQGGSLQSILSNPMAQAAISGLIGFAANRALNGMANRGQQPPPQQNSNQGQSQNNWSQDQGQSQNQSYGGGSALPGFEGKQQGS